MSATTSNGTVTARLSTLQLHTRLRELEKFSHAREQYSAIGMSDEEVF